MFHGLPHILNTNNYKFGPRAALFNKIGRNTNLNILRFVVVTIYATLGDDAIAHGINETDVSTVITTYDLLPKFRKILAKTPKVDTIIYMEDQLKSIDKAGYKQGIKIIGYKDVVLKGASSKIGEWN